MRCVNWAREFDAQLGERIVDVVFHRMEERCSCAATSRLVTPCAIRLTTVSSASREFFERQPAVMAELWTQYLDLRKTGALADPPVEVWPFADARQALQAVEHRRSLGKNVLSRRT